MTGLYMLTYIRPYSLHGYVKRPPPLGDYQEDLTNENPGKTIISFVTREPKNYAHTVCHMSKGRGRVNMHKVLCSDCHG